MMIQLVSRINNLSWNVDVKLNTFKLMKTNELPTTDHTPSPAMKITGVKINYYHICHPEPHRSC